ncbi:MAG: transglycosylase SLT domain-containing protein [Bacteriovoracaceae bacterium]|nr:transglycosylase SLT domain-containing protein [Bacteriovoracaceae bacterium]
MKKIITIISTCLFVSLNSCASSQNISTESSDQVSTIQSANKIIKKLRYKKRTAGRHFLTPVKSKSYHFWINYFSKKDTERFHRYLDNGWKHKKMIEEIFQSYNLPKELFYVGLIESGYNMKAKSHAKAVGPWQFIEDTGRRYQLKINSHVDERIHLVKATHAAARYFRDLYQIFGSWELALSAYNSGEYGLMRRIRKYQTKNFYELSRIRGIAKETRHYIPKVLAALEILTNPEKYRIRIPSETTSPYVYTQKYRLKKSHNLNTIAKQLDINPDVLKILNPDLKSNRTPKYHYNEHVLFVPKKSEKKELVSYLEKNYPEEFNTTQVHLVRRGENLHLIAKKYRVTPESIKEENNLRRSKIFPGQKLFIAQN